MAHPIAKFQAVPFEDLEAVKRQEARTAVENALYDNPEAVVQALALVRQLHDKGLLDAAIALLEQGQDVLEIVVKQANKPGYAGGIKSFIALVQGVAKIDAKALSQLLSGLGFASQALVDESVPQVQGALGMWQTLMDPDVSLAVSRLLAFLKAFGQSLQPDSKSHSQSGNPDIGVLDPAASVKL
ncbi:DUF1641 domain-containing protein [Alicyclobacillus tolerans]|uniref:DUF1641 domain-containing protein n=1 Tax=Alicyclobacillus tolerans TaxID=90970 RepID=UPI001F1AEEBE|nr:DUF1641 domain-containing protein [Alicyclobacillus tolerans]MCF8564522.1 DUF1641 domain-containing protein [Alicyclobacillus tolerans]